MKIFMATAALLSTLSLTSFTFAFDQIDFRTISVNCGDGGTGLQTAINSANSGDVIKLYGRCKEAVAIIDKNLTIQGVDGAKIECPDSSWNFLPYTSRHPIVMAVNGVVSLKNLIIDGLSRSDYGAYSSLMGVYFLNADGELMNSWVTGIRRISRASDWNTIPVRVLNTAIGPSQLLVRPRLVKITKNIIDNFESDGIFANTNDDASHLAPLQINIISNTINGAGVMYESQNGIQLLGFGSGLYSIVTASVQNNLITDTISNSGLWESSAILTAPYLDGSTYVLRNMPATYTGNKLMRFNDGIAIFSEGKTNISSNNVIADGDVGLDLMGHQFNVGGNDFLNLKVGVLSEGTNLVEAKVVKNNKFTNVIDYFAVLFTNDFIPSRFRGASGIGH